MAEGAQAGGKKVDRQIKEKKWEQVQIKAFTHWVNTFLEPNHGMKIQESLTKDFGDGLTIIYFLEALTKQKLKKRYSKNPRMRPLLIENCHLALEFLKEQGVDSKYLTISAEDLVDGNLKLLLGFLWVLFRKFRISQISGGDNDTEDGLLTWCRQVTEGYEGVSITKFDKSFSDGLAFLAMIDKFDPEVLDYKNMLEDNSTQENVEAAFKLAEQHLGVPQLLDAKELIEGSIDERSVVLYVSLFFHAFVSRDEARKKEDSLKVGWDKRETELSDQVKQLRAQLEGITEERDILSANNSDLKREKSEQKEAYEEKIQERDEKIDKLEQENEDLRDDLREWKAKYAKLKEKVEERSKLELGGLDVLRKNLIEHVNDMNVWKDYLEQDLDYESETIQERTEAEIKDRAFEGQLQYLADALESENRKLQVLLKQREIEQKEADTNAKSPRDAKSPREKSDRSEKGEDKPKKSRKTKSKKTKK